MNERKFEVGIREFLHPAAALLRLLNEQPQAEPAPFHRMPTSKVSLVADAGQH